VPVGPVFTRETVVAPRRRRFYISRAVYAIALLLLMCTAWMVLAGTQTIRNLGDMARFGSILFQVLAPLQLVLMTFMAAVQAATNIAVEKDKQTMILLLMTRLSNSELVLGKLFASLLGIAVLLATALPIFMFIVLFGGTSIEQVGWTFLVTAVTVFAAGSLGSTLALWREKTFQTLALVGLAMVFWVGAAEAAGIWMGNYGSISGPQVAQSMNPLRAVLAASLPSIVDEWQTAILPYLAVMTGVALLLNLVAIARIRTWNPGREVRPMQEEAGSVSIFSSKDAASAELNEHIASGEAERQEHVDSRRRISARKSRRVWDNPVLWREACTWAYGRKIVYIRMVYWILAGLVGWALLSMVQSGTIFSRGAESSVSIPAGTWAIGPFILLSLVMINSLGVTSMTNERDGRSLDLLLVTDLSPREFLFGKLSGVLYVTLDAVLLPVAMCVFLCTSGALSLENLIYLVTGLLILDVFVATLGLHCGMIYANSRQAIGASLGTVFFLFLGIITAMAMMVSFTGNVEAQISPFLACIVGGGVGLYVALGSRNPSPALAMAAGLLPLAMFFSITSLLVGRYLSVFLVVAFIYGFTTTAMIMPALGEYNISMGRARTNEEE
jgi:ABC-type transport system involved in multi-copper enzyme maturation permease subunit